VFPLEVRARVFASLPERLRITHVSSNAAVTFGKAFDSFLEGLTFDRNGDLYCVDVSFGRVFKIDKSGAFELVAKYEGNPSGLAAHPDGRLAITDRVNGLLWCDPRGGDIRPVLDTEAAACFSRLSDLAIADNGDIYVTDPGDSDILNPCGRVWRVCGAQPPELMLDGLAGPNGIAVDAECRQLYVSAMRANDVIRADLLPGRGVGRVRNFVRLGGGGGPDGLALDHHSRVAVAHFQFGCAWQFDAKGEAVVRVRLECGMMATSVTFGSVDGRLYIAEAETGTIQVAEIPSEAFSTRFPA
jgi:gluconolactonase